MTDAAAVPTIIPTHLVTGAATRTDLEDWGPLAEATGVAMTASGLTLFSDGKGAEAGIWECTPGPSRWEQGENEFVHVLWGRMTVTPDGGDPAEIGPGDTFVVPAGWKGTWDIHETLRKVYVVF